MVSSEMINRISATAPSYIGPICYILETSKDSISKKLGIKLKLTSRDQT